MRDQSKAANCTQQRAAIGGNEAAWAEKEQARQSRDEERRGGRERERFGDDLSRLATRPVKNPTCGETQTRLEAAQKQTARLAHERPLGSEIFYAAIRISGRWRTSDNVHEFPILFARDTVSRVSRVSPSRLYPPRRFSPESGPRRQLFANYRERRIRLDREFVYLFILSPASHGREGRRGRSERVTRVSSGVFDTCRRSRSLFPPVHRSTIQKGEPRKARSLARA